MKKNLNAFMDFDIPVITEEQKTYSSPDIFYKPNAVMGKNGSQSYSSIIRFVPWFEDPTESIVSKRSCYLKNPSNNIGKYVDCFPIPKPNGFGNDIITSAFFGLRSSPRADLVAESKHFSSIQNHFSVIQVIEDKQQPELQGKLLIFQYGGVIYNKILSELKPTTEFKDKHNPFNILKGKLFNLSMSSTVDPRDNRRYPTYDKSEFISEKMVGILNKDTSEYITDIEEAVEYLGANSPNLMESAFKPHNEEIKQHIAESLLAIIPPSPVLNDLKSSYPQYFAMVSTPITPTTPKEEKVEKAPKAKKQTPPKEETPFDVDEIDELDADEFGFDFE